MADEEEKPEPADHDRIFIYPPNFMDPDLPSGVMSPSQFDTYRKCPKRYEYRHVYKVISPPGVAMIKGTAVHRGAEVTHKKMIETGEPLALIEAVQAVSDSFDSKRPDIEDWEDENPDHVKDRALNAFKVYYHEAVPIIKPVKAEHAFAVKMGTVPVRGVIDLVDSVEEDAFVDGVKPRIEVVSDLKITGARWPEQRVRQSTQLTFYALVMSTFRVRYDFILDQKSGIKYDQNKSMRTQHDFKLLIEDLEAVVDGIKRGYFPRSDGTNWWCLSLDTEVLTQRGWKKYSDILPGDQVMTLDMDSMLLEWQLPTAVFKKSNSRRMVNYLGRVLRFCVTDDHEMLIRSSGRSLWRKVPAKDVEGKGSIGFLVAAQMPRPGVPLSDALIELSGWMCAEGTFATGCNSIQIYQTYGTEHWKRIETLLNELGIQYSTSTPKRTKVGRFNIHAEDGKQIRETVQTSKSIPAWLWQASARQFRIFLKGMGQGDGHQAGRCLSINQKNEQMIDDLQALCLSNRMSAIKNGPRVSSTGGTFYGLSILDGVTERFPEPANVARNYVKDRYDEEVWCVSVPNQNIVTRYQGHVLIMGNCTPKFCGYYERCRGPK